MWWPVLALIGFVVLMTVVIALGTVSTRRYERERGTRVLAARPTLERTVRSRPVVRPSE